MWHLKMIPKTVYLYWGRNRPLSYMRYMTVHSLSVLNPEWLIKVYYPKNSYRGEEWQSLEHKNSQSYKGHDYFDHLRHLKNVRLREFSFSDRLSLNEERPEVFKSDIIRLYLLSTQGGVWSDFDTIYIRSLESIVFNTENYQDMNAIMCYRAPARKTYNSIGLLMAGDGGKEIFKELFNLACELYAASTGYQDLGSRLYNDYFETKGIDEIRETYRIGKAIIGNLPYCTVYLSRSRGLWHFFTVKGIRIESERVGIHWYAGHEMSSELESKITAMNIDNHSRVFLIRKMLQARNIAN